MMGIGVPETCWAYKKYNKIISSIYLVFVIQLSQWCKVQHTYNIFGVWQLAELTILRLFFIARYNCAHEFI